MLPAPSPTFVQTFRLVVTSVHANISPEVLFNHKCPTAAGFVELEGSVADTVVSDRPLKLATNPVKLLPSIAGKAPVSIEAG
jgi:hypothetical protein